MSGAGDRPLSLAHLTCLSLAPPDLVRHAADAGFDLVGAVRLTPTRDGRGHPMLGRSPLRRQTLAALRETGLRVLDVEVFRVRPQTTAIEAEPLLEAGAELGAGHLLTTVEDEEPERRAGTYAGLCELASAYGLRCMLEPMVFSAVRTPAEAVRLLTDAGPTGAGVLIDALHLSRAGCGPEQVSAVDPGLLPYAQLCDASYAGAAPSLADAVREAVSGRLPPGHGVLPLAALVERLPPAVPLSLEVPAPAAATDPAGWCARLVSATRALLAPGHHQQG